MAGDRRVKDVQVLQKDGTYAPLDPEKTYEATIYRDADDAHYKENPQAYVIEKRNVTFHDYLPVKMAPGGGFAISFEEK